VPAFAGAIGFLIAWNLLTWLALQRDWVLPPPQIFIQLCADIAVLSTLLALTGGAWNPTVPILFVHSVLGAMLLQGRRSLAFFFILLISVIAMQFTAQIPPALENSLLPRTILFPAQFIVALVFWILTAWLSRTLGALQADLSAARERKTRIDRLRAVGALAAGRNHPLPPGWAWALPSLDSLGGLLPGAHQLDRQCDPIEQRRFRSGCHGGCHR
jgi:two-component system sensor histidine kinase RegB